MPLLIVPVLVVLALIALIPISLVQRCRMGTARQRAMGWLATLNVTGLTLSAVLFLASAAFTSFWVHSALTYTAAGLLGGCLLGIIGLSFTRWEPAIGSLHYTPNRAAYTAFLEGWREYASDLAGEMGMYADPYDRAGRVSMDLFLSTRLVVDTGMNALGWSRERAMDSMRAQLGPAFDVRRFHQVVLGHGAMPLGVLEPHVERVMGGARELAHRGVWPPSRTG